MASSDVLEMQLVDAGTKLLSIPVLVDELHKMLDHAESVLIKVEQSPPTSTLEAIIPAINALTNVELLKHPDTAIKVLVASCLCEIIRITAPVAPFDDEKIKVIFQLIVSCFEDLSDCTSHSYYRRARVLETLYKVRFCVVMLDLEMESLITEMFVHFLKGIRDYQPDDIFSSMVQVMTLLVEESESLSLVLLSPMLEALRADNQDVFPAARSLAKKVFENCAAKLKPFLLEATESNTLTSDDYDEVVADICRVACTINNDDPFSTDLQANDKDMAPAESTQVLKEIVDHEIEGESTRPVNITVSVDDCGEVPSAEHETSKNQGDYQYIVPGMDVMEENKGESGGVDCTKDDQHSDQLTDSNEDKFSDLGKTKSSSGNSDSSAVIKSKIFLKLVKMHKDSTSGSYMAEDDHHTGKSKYIAEVSKHESGESDSGKVVTIELKSQSTPQISSNKSEGTNEATNAEICDLKNSGVEKVKRSRKFNFTGSSTIDEKTHNDSDVRPKRRQKKKIFFGEVIENDSTKLTVNTEGALDISTETKGSTDLLVDASNNIDEGTRNNSLGRPKRQLKKKVFFGEMSEEDMSPSLLSSKKRRAKVEKQAVANEMDESGNMHLQMSERKGGRKRGQLKDSSDEDTIKTPSESDKEKHEVPPEMLKLYDNEDHMVETSKRKRISGKGKQVNQSPKSSLNLLDEENAEEVECVEENLALKKAKTSRKVKDAKLGDDDLTEETPKMKSGSRIRKKALPSLSRSKGKRDMKVETKKTYKRRKRQGNRKVVDSPEDADNKKLVGLRVKIWWPQDAEYYEGVIESFDSVTKNHKVLYNDGDIEILTLEDEIWEIVKDDDDSEERDAKQEVGAKESLVILSQMTKKRKTATPEVTEKSGDDLKALRDEKDSVEPKDLVL